jgi:hypothetical protein
VSAPNADSRSWASYPLDGSDTTLERLAEAVPVSLIATFELKTCSVNETAEHALSRLDLDGFDYVPVVSSDAVVVGLLDRTMTGPSEQLVRHVMQPLDGSHLISADAGILSFVEMVDRNPYALVLQGRNISGIVTLSDLQKLAVRPALFTLITCLELMMATFIRLRAANDAEWLCKLSPGRRAKTEEKSTALQAADMALDRVSTTEFADKRKLAVEMGAFRDRASSASALRDIEQLRNLVAHSGDYAITPARARNLGRTVRSARALIQELHASINHRPEGGVRHVAF